MNHGENRGRGRGGVRGGGRGGGRGRGRGGGRGGGRGRGGKNRHNENHQNTPITLNDIIQYVRFNKSTVKLNLDTHPEFEQGIHIPKKVVNEDTWYPEKDFEAHLHREQDKNPLIYQQDEIINIPRNLHEIYDPNFYYSFGLLENFTLPYSILYQINKDFAFQNDKDKKDTFQTWKSTLLDSIPESMKKKKVAIQSALQRDNFHEKEVLDCISTINSTGITMVDLNENQIMYHTIGSENHCIVFKCSKYYFPLIHMYGQNHEESLAQATVDHFTTTTQ